MATKTARLPCEKRALELGQNVVVLLRIAGNVFAFRRTDAGLRFRWLAYDHGLRATPDQSGALALLRAD